MRRNLGFLALVMLVALTFSLSCFAETTEDWAASVLDTIGSHKLGNVTVLYTDDSAVKSGISTKPEIDLLGKQVLFNIENNLPFGYAIYDDPSTDYIDGIRLNDNTVTSYSVPIDYTVDTDFVLVVRTVYAEGFTGTLAQISDGTYDWTKLLENPVGLLMALYYVISTVTVIVGLFAMWFGKGKKVKTADDISKKVETVAHETAISIVEEQVLPIVTAFQNTAQGLVKAFALTTSKSKEAPSALLDVLQTVSSTDAVAAIEQAKALIAENKLKSEESRQQIIDNLKNIAQTSQEVSSNDTEQSKETEEEVAIF